MKNQLIKLWENGLAHIFVGSFLTKFISFFGSIILVRALSKFDYGVLTYLENIYGYVWIFAGLGLSNAILRFVVLKDDLATKEQYFVFAISRAFIYNIILIVLVGIINCFYPHREEYQGYSWLLYVLLCSLPFQYLTESALANERAMFDNRKYVLFSIVLTSSVIISKALSGKLFGIRGAVYSQPGIYFLLACLFIYSTVHRHYHHIPANLSTKINNKKEVIIYSFQYMITNGLWAVFMLNDTFLLGRFCAAEVLAEYKVAYTIPGCVTLISSSIGIFVAPYFVKNENNRRWIAHSFKQVYLASAVLVAIICIGISVLSRPIVLLLYGKQYLSVIPIMRLLLIASFCNCGLRYTTANILAAMGQIKYNMVISLVGTILQISSNLFMIPRFGTIGVAITSCFVYFVMASCLVYLFYKKYLA